MPSRAAASRLRACTQRSAGSRLVEEERQQNHHQGAATENPEELIVYGDRAKHQWSAERELGICPGLIAHCQNHNLLNQ
jgi:hypothetical protein